MSNNNLKYIVHVKINYLIYLIKNNYLDKANNLILEIKDILSKCEEEFVKQQMAILLKFLNKNKIKLENQKFFKKIFYVDELVKEIYSGISLVTCCMNRMENLAIALKSWLKFPQINQIVIVDWSSKKPVKESLKELGIYDDRIFIVRVNNQKRWILSWAYNLGFRVAKYDKILKVDADIILKPNFFEKNILKKGTFISGDWRIVQKGQEHINGFFFIRREDLMEVKGFNEFITTYGWDDDDLYIRLQEYGLHRIRVDPETIYHIPHNDSTRIGKDISPKCALEEIYSNVRISILKNKFLSTVMPIWNKYRSFTPFEVVLLEKNYIEVEQLPIQFSKIPDHIYKDAEYYALIALISSILDTFLFNIKKECLYSLLTSRKSISEISKLEMKLLSYSEKINWYSKLFLIYFDPNIQLSDKKIIIDNLVKLASKKKFTILIESKLFEEINICKEKRKKNNILSIPENFFKCYYVHDLPQIKLNSISQLIKEFKRNQAFWTYLEKEDAKKIVKEIITHPIRSVRKKLYIHVQHGLGNRLRALASATVIANRDNRDLILIWEPDDHCNCYIHDLFKYKGKVICNLDIKKLKNVKKYTYMENEKNSCKDKYIFLYPNKDIYIKSAYVINNVLTDWESENEVLRSLEPVDKIKNMVSEIDTTGYIGVHIRMQVPSKDPPSYESPKNWSLDSHKKIIYWRRKSHYNNFIKRIDQLIERYPYKGIFLATDTKEVFHIFKNRYKDKVRFLYRDVFDRSKKQLMFAVADAILLSRCSYLLGSYWSSFTELVIRLSTTIKKVEMSGIDF